jgi:hypothetical protein
MHVPAPRADTSVVLTRAFQSWLKDQPLGTRIFFNGVVVAVSFWLAFATGVFLFILIGLAIAVFTFNLDDVRRARHWLDR